MSERFADTGAARLCYEELGDPGGPLVLLIMGLGLPLTWWRDDFCAALVARGHRVVRFDHRDTGRSTPFTGPGVTGWQFLRRRARPVYTLEDMAGDAAGLIAHLGGGPAHVVGASMGAMIAQTLAIEHPDRVASLVSIMGRPGDGRTGRVSARMFPGFLRPSPRDPDRAVESLVKTFRRIGSAGRTEQDDEDVRIAMRAAMARDETDGTGSGRQLAAIIAERDRTDGLRRILTPATVIHGTRDKVILPSGGRATAAAIAGAELVELEGMGHDLPRWTWPAVLDAVSATAARAGSG